jgi:hypothetical protein
VERRGVAPCSAAADAGLGKEPAYAPIEIGQYGALVIEPGDFRMIEIAPQVRAVAPRIESIKHPLEGYAQTGDRRAFVLVGYKVALGQRAHHARCCAGDFERDALAPHHALEPF